MNLKKILANILTGVLITFSFPVLAFAQSTTQSNTIFPPGGVRVEANNTIPPVGSSAGYVNSKLGAVDARLQARAETEIQRRVTSLTEIATRLNSLKHISEAQKTSFTANIQTEIGSLNTLLTKIRSDNDTATLRADVKSVVTSFRVYALYMPQIRLLVGADALMDVSANLSSLSARLQERITNAQSSGQNVSALQASLSDMQTKITDAQMQANTMIAELTPLTPDGYPGNKTTLMDARSKFQTGIQDLKTAAQDAKQIIKGLISMRPTIPPAPPSSSSAAPLPTTP